MYSYFNLINIIKNIISNYLFLIFLKKMNLKKWLHKKCNK